MSRVIVVDDQKFNRMVIGRLAATLEPDVEVALFADPLDALSYSQDRAPDLLITDFQMPNIDGAELIRRFRDVSACREVPAVIVTALQDVELRALALEAGANDFLLSPLDHEAFRAQSRYWLETRRSSLDAQLVTDLSGRQPNDRGAPAGGVSMLNTLIENLSSKLRSRNEQVAQLAAEMHILLDTTNAAAIFVNSDLSVQHFNHGALEIFDLGASHIGQRLTAVKCKLDYDSVSTDFSQMLTSGETCERYLQSRIGRRHYRLRLLPLWRGDALQGGVFIFTAILAWHERPYLKPVH